MSEQFVHRDPVWIQASGVKEAPRIVLPVSVSVQTTAPLAPETQPVQLPAKTVTVAPSHRVQQQEWEDRVKHAIATSKVLQLVPFTAPYEVTYVSVDGVIVECGANWTVGDLERVLGILLDDTWRDVKSCKVIELRPAQRRMKTASPGVFSPPYGFQPYSLVGRAWI